MTTQFPAQEQIDLIIDRTGFTRSVVEFMWDEYFEAVDGDVEGDETFSDYVAEVLGNASFVIAASKGFSINGCLAAYDYGCQTVSEEGLTLDQLEGVIDEIELEGLLNTEDDSEEET